MPFDREPTGRAFRGHFGPSDRPHVKAGATRDVLDTRSICPLVRRNFASRTVASRRPRDVWAVAAVAVQRGETVSKGIGLEGVPPSDKSFGRAKNIIFLYLPGRAAAARNVRPQAGRPG